MPIYSCKYIKAPDTFCFLLQLCGRAGGPREWLYSWYNRGGGATADAEFAHDEQFKLYSDGRFYNLRNDEVEKSPLGDNALSADAKAAKVRLQEALFNKDGLPAFNTAVNVED